MNKKYGLRFRKFERICLLPADNNEKYSQNDYLIVDTNRGFECGRIVMLCPGAEEKHTFDIIVNKIKRKATSEDIEKLKTLEKKEEEFLKICNQQIEVLKIPIKIVGIELIFDEHKAFFHYRKIEEDTRKKTIIHVRPLIAELQNQLKIKVELREVGMRGEAKIIGGLGECGKTLCCTNWLHKSKPITVKMAKEQNLPINITKLSGVCGRLKCCLRYEHECYSAGKILGIIPKKEIQEKSIKDYTEIFKDV